MNLSKTAKRFLSSTMAIALAGGSVLAFGNSALAAPPETKAEAENVSFTGTVELECGVETAPSQATYTQATSTVAGEERTTGLSATTTVDYDCNSDTVDIQVSGATHSYTAPTNASALTATHSWEWGKGAKASNAFAPTSGAADLNLGETTDANGDVQVAIESIWTGAGEEFFAGTQTASLTLTGTAKSERYISSNSLD